LVKPIQRIAGCARIWLSAHRRRTRSRRRAAVPDGLVDPIQRMRHRWPRLQRRALIGDLRARKRVPARLLKVRLPHV
jgi:hypothetical protein